MTSTKPNYNAHVNHQMHYLCPFNQVLKVLRHEGPLGPDPIAVLLVPLSPVRLVAGGGPGPMPGLTPGSGAGPGPPGTGDGAAVP